MSHAVTVIKSSEIKASGGQTEGMTRNNAIVDMCDNLCSLIMTAEPRTSSAVHHHGEQNTIIYAVKGHGSIVADGGKTRQNLAPGDFALIPAFTVHQEVNDGDEQVIFAVIRSGKSPVTKNLSGWGQSDIE